MRSRQLFVGLRRETNRVVDLLGLVHEQMGDIFDPFNKEAVLVDHEMSGLQQQIGEMTPEKPSST